MITSPAATEIQNWPIDRLVFYARNPRKNDHAVDAVAASIREFGFRQPIVVDPQGVIIIGHTRLKAAIKLGLRQVPVHVADLDPARAKALRIADNQSATIAEWDVDLLPVELASGDETLPIARCLELYRIMVRTRVLEERCIKMSKSGEAFFWVGGPGEEAFNACLGLQIHKGFGPAFDYRGFESKLRRQRRACVSRAAPADHDEIVFVHLVRLASTSKT